MSAFGRTEREEPPTQVNLTQSACLAREKEAEGKLTVCWLQYGNMYTILSLTLVFHTELASQSVIVTVCAVAPAVWCHVQTCAITRVSLLYNNNKQPKYHHHPSCNTAWSQWDGQMLDRLHQARICVMSVAQSINLPHVQYNMWQQHEGMGRHCSFQ